MNRRPKKTPDDALLVPDYVAAPRLGVSIGYLRKDRRTRQIIPFVRIGDKAMYELPHILEVLRSRGGRRT